MEIVVRYARVKRGSQHCFIFFRHGKIDEPYFTLHKGEAEDLLKTLKEALSDSEE